MNKKLRQVRLQKRLSQENMAFELGISQKSYSNIENGKTRITFDKIFQIAKVLEINPCMICPFQKQDIINSKKGGQCI